MEPNQAPVKLLETIFAEFALPVRSEVLRDALAARARSHDRIMRLRSVPLAYTPIYVEPLTALRWIENGGHTTE